MLKLCSAVRLEKATLLRRKSTNRMSFRRHAKSRFSRLTKDGQFRIAPEALPRPGSSLLIRIYWGIIGSQSKPFRMISLQIYRNKSFAVISLQKIGGGGGWNISPKTLSLGAE